MFPKFSWPTIWTVRLPDGRVVDCTTQLAQDLVREYNVEVISTSPGLCIEYQGHNAIIKLVHKEKKTVLNPN